MSSGRRQAEVLLSRGGTVLSGGSDKYTAAEIRSSPVEVGSQDDLTELLSRFAGRA